MGGVVDEIALRLTLNSYHETIPASFLKRKWGKYHDKDSLVARLGLTMARYTCLFTVAISVNNLPRVLNETLESCNLDVIYDTGDYMMAREVPGQVSFPKLVTVEVLIDKTTATDEEIRMNFVIKNEELPLQVDNHCRQMYNQVSQAVSDNQHWKLIETVGG
jgi:hypothetical protein